MSSKVSSLIICVFLLITIFQFFPRCLSARNLLDVPQSSMYMHFKKNFNGGGGGFVADGSGGDTENNDQSKSDVEGSKPGHAGSAADENVPSGGVVNRPPSPSTYVVAPSKPTNGSQQVTRTTCNGNQVVTYNNGGQTVTRSCNGSQVTTSTDANGNVVQQTVTSYNNQNISTNGCQHSSSDYGTPNLP
ncbi:hypothetical protein JRO89_XS05G0015900 [Xanthoceras sorbifolium]|uniref:Uncharacterized protein n=1 Tax=Xanthoceras sorbifolium TaxID=99658 RepID=A0ABQ8HZV0_9ROSI|nr:hypothetical protein JRO89_XS05G0015900 [Xanthoceras sorbifolium]